MACYKYSHYLTNLSDPRFDSAHPPETAAPDTGIYKCQGCGKEVVAVAGDPLPASSHHQHSLAQAASAGAWSSRRRKARVIPRLAKRAEGSLGRSDATAIFDASSERRFCSSLA
jgi:hypothetical protein